PSDAPMLTGLLKHQDAEVRASAARGLGKCNVEAKVALAPLAGALKDGSGLVREAALRSMRRFGADAKDHVPAMMEALHDSDPGVKRAACAALGAVGPDAKAAAKRLADAVLDFDVRKDAFAALMQIGPAAAHDAVPKLVGLLTSSNREDRLLALTTLAVLKPTGPEVESLIPKLITAFEDRDASVRDAVAVTLSQMGKPAVLPLIRALADPTPTVRVGAVTALGEMGSAAGPQAQNAVTQLAQIDRDPDVREACDKALAKFRR
ncbi:MAG TPA: HEAT repeat domain-containing protein, partial [Gemmataceae bacterium]|nr:HEAT repeat domain-containing protein [Gemmataceae bacterium]